MYTVDSGIFVLGRYGDIVNSCFYIVESFFRLGLVFRLGLLGFFVVSEINGKRYFVGKGRGILLL